MQTFIRYGFVVLTVLALGCGASVGDSCEKSIDCGTELKCDLFQPGGYCTKASCEVNGCPSEAVCVTFQNDSSFCMLRCEGVDDCRDGYTCVTNFGDAAFCNAKAFTAP
jgi:hypothetical protein